MNMKNSIMMGHKLLMSRLKCLIHPNSSYLRCSIFLKSVLISECIKSPKTCGSLCQVNKTEHVYNRYNTKAHAIYVHYFV